MRKTIKFAHTMGGIGMLGAIAGLLATHATMPDPMTEPMLYLQQREVMAVLGRYLLLPAMGLTLVSGLASMAVVRAYQNAGWAWIKLGTGILMFEGTLLGIEGPIQREARVARQIIEANADLARLGTELGAEYASLWALGTVAVLNVVLAIYRPKFGNRGLFAPSNR